MAKTILFIEDEVAMQKAMKEFLISKGYNVISALDGEMGLIVTKAKMPDMVLLDLVLPRKSGFDVLKEMRSDKEMKDIPVIVLTNLSDMADIEKILALGVTNYMIKSDQGLENIWKVIKDSLGE